MVQSFIKSLGVSSICVYPYSLIMDAVKKLLVKQSDRVYPTLRDCGEINDVRNHYSLHDEFPFAYSLLNAKFDDRYQSVKCLNTL